MSIYGGFTLWSYLMRKKAASAVAPLSLIIPIASMMLTALILGEEVSALRMAGARLVLVGLALSNIRLGATKSCAVR